MPTYVYGCASCGCEFERFQKMTDAPVRKCPECARRTVERKLTPSSFVLKGGGWYSDGYSSRGSASASSAPARSSGGSGGSSP
jgi:putative FmdB family regulatory protein